MNFNLHSKMTMSLPVEEGVDQWPDTPLEALVEGKDLHQQRKEKKEHLASPSIED